MQCLNPPSPSDAIHQRELNEIMNVTVHRELAVAAALDYCAEEGIRPPPSLVTEAAALVRDLLKREKAHRRGRAAGHVARYRQDQWDVERWDAVEEVRRMRKKVSLDMKIMQEHADIFNGTKRWEYRRRQLAWFRNGTFDCASRLLVGRDARVGSEAMKASYRRCNRRAGQGRIPDRYYVFDERFLMKLGFPRLSDRKPGTKFLHLYDLT